MPCSSCGWEPFSDSRDKKRMALVYHFNHHILPHSQIPQLFSHSLPAFLQFKLTHPRWVWHVRWWWWWRCCQQRSHWHVVQFHSVWHNFNSTAAGAPVSAWSYLTNISTSLVHLSPTYLSSSRSHISVLHPLFVASWRYIQLKLWDVFHYFRSRLITHWRSSFNDQQNTWFLPQTHF